jgi:hypothetical protein
MRTRAVKDPDVSVAREPAGVAKHIPGGFGGRKTDKEILLTVRKQFKDGGAFPKWGPPDEKVETIDVLGFAVEPAGVNVKLGVTIGLANFGSARIDVGCYMPCYREEMSEAYDAAKSFVAERVELEVKEVKAFHSTGEFPGSPKVAGAKEIVDTDKEYEF